MHVRTHCKRRRIPMNRNQRRTRQETPTPLPSRGPSPANGGGLLMYVFTYIYICMCPTCGAVATEIKTQAPVLFPRSRHTCARRARWATPLEKEVWAGSRLHREPNPHLLRPLLAEVHERLARVLRGLCYCRAQRAPRQVGLQTERATQDLESTIESSRGEKVDSHDRCQTARTNIFQTST